MNVSKRLLVTGSISLLALVTNGAHADVLLTLGVTNVQQNVCSGYMQPSCADSAAASFVETMRFISGAPLAPPTGSSTGGLNQSQAYYGFANASTGSPFTSALSARLSGPITSSAIFTELDSSYDTGAVSGTSAALISTDAFSDVTNASGIRSQQEYKRSYNLFTGLFSDAALYTDLVNESLAQFFEKYVGSMTGAFDELGTASNFDPQSLGLSTYDFTEYTGDVMLLAAESVPEPGTLPLLAIAALGMIARFRSRKGSGASARTARIQPAL